MEAMNPVGEEPYEINLDNHGCEEGPKTGRLRALNKVSLQRTLISSKSLESFPVPFILAILSTCFLQLVHLYLFNNLLLWT